VKNYNKKGKKTHILAWLIGEAIFIFVIATSAIILYDMYINIDIEENGTYVAEKMAKETSNNEIKEADNNISEILENVSRSVVRDIKNNIKQYRNI